MKAPSTSLPDIDRVFLWSVLGIVALTVLSHVVGALAFVNSLWGAHLFAFFPPTVLLVASLLLIGLCSLVAVRRKSIAEWQPSPQTENRARLPLALALVVGAVGLWMLRSDNTYLGDGTILINSIADGQTFHPREPLTMIAQQAYYRFAGSWFDVDEPALAARNAIAVGSVVNGVLFAIVAWFLSRELTWLRPHGPGDSHTLLPIIIALILCLQGYAQLFFGYIENYAFYTLGVAAYLSISLRFLRGGGPLLLPALVLLACIAFHIASVILLPSFAFLCVAGFVSPERRRGVIRDLLIVAALFVLLHYSLSAWGDDYSFARTLLEAAGLAVTREHERASMFSGLHLRDFFNEQFLIGPLGIFIFLAATIAALIRKQLRSPSRLFLFLAALGYLGAGWLAGDSNLGYARDWDVWAPAGLVLTVAGIGLFLSLGSGRRYARPALLCALLVSIYHTGPWVTINASAERGLARLKTLPLGLGRTEVLVSQWYRSRGGENERLEWLEKAVEVNPANNNAHYLLGVYYSERGNMEAAAKSFARAAELRRDKVLFRQRLADALIATGRDEEAIPHLQFELERDPGNTGRWMIYGETLRKTGRNEQATVVFERMLAMYTSALSDDPGSYESNLACGWLLYNLERFDESLPFFAMALERRPDSDSAHCLLGYSLASMGRADEAADHFRRCIAINPNRPDGTDIEAWLGDPEN